MRDGTVIVDGDAIHRIPRDEVRLVEFVANPLHGPPFVRYQLVGAPDRTFVMMNGVGGVDGPRIVRQIALGAGAIIKRISATSPFEFTLGSLLGAKIV